jgi:hypothetical protein
MRAAPMADLLQHHARLLRGRLGLPADAVLGPAGAERLPVYRSRHNPSTQP